MASVGDLPGGIVGTQTDNDTTFIRANGVPGVFWVENNLQVERASKGRR